MMSDRWMKHVSMKHSDVRRPYSVHLYLSRYTLHIESCPQCPDLWVSQTDRCGVEAPHTFTLTQRHTCSADDLTSPMGSMHIGATAGRMRRAASSAP